MRVSLSLADARSQCEVTLPSNSSEVDYNTLPSVCTASSSGDACLASAWCCYETLTVPNFRPVVSMVDRSGAISGVFYPGFWQSDWWDDGWQQGVGTSRAQANGTQLIHGYERGPNLVRATRIVTLRDAAISFNGHVISRGQRFGVANLRICHALVSDTKLSTAH